MPASLSRIFGSQRTRADHSPTTGLRLAVAVAASFRKGGKPPSAEVLADAVGAPPQAVRELVDTLVTHELLVEVGGNGEPGYLPARDPQEMSAAEIPVVALVAAEDDQRTGDFVRVFAVTEPGAYEAYCVPLSRRFKHPSTTRICSKTVVVEDLSSDLEVEIAVSASDLAKEPQRK